MGGLNWNKAGQQCVTVYCKLFYSNSGFTQMEMAKSRLCLTHFVSQNSDGKGDGYISHYQYFETGIVPKSFRKKSKHDPDHSEYMCREHPCCSVNIHVLNSINNCFALEAQVGANFQCVTGKSHNHLWNVYRD